MAKKPTYEELEQSIKDLENKVLSRNHLEEMYRVLVEHSLQGLIIIQDARVVYSNDAFSEISGYTVDEILSLSPDEVQAMIHPDDQALVWGRYQARLEGKPVPPRYEYRGIRKDGSVRWLEMISNRIEFQGKVVIQAAIIDVTDRKLAEEALRKSEQEKSAILDSLVEHVIHEDKDMKIQWANQAACESVGMALEELINQHCYEVWPRRSDPCPDCPVMKAIKTGTPQEIEKATPDGRNWFIRGYPLRDARG
jgi:PAS domain S-box-containing protein